MILTDLNSKQPKFFLNIEYAYMEVVRDTQTIIREFTLFKKNSLFRFTPLPEVDLDIWVDNLNNYVIRTDRP